MKKNILLLSTLFIALFLNGQESTSNPSSSEHALSISGSMFFKTKYNNSLTLSSLNYHYSWQNRKKPNLYNSVNIGIGKLFPNPSNYGTLVVLDYSLVLKEKRHFFEIGVGIVADHFLMHLNLGYKYHFRNQIFFRAVLMPSSYFIAEQMGGGASARRNLLFLNFSLGYRFGPKITQLVSRTTNYLFDHLEIQFFTNPLSFSKITRIRPTHTLMINYSLYNNKSTLQLGLGMGSVRTGSYHIQLNHLYGNKHHFFETNFNVIFVSFLNPHNEYKNEIYEILQPQLGYRYYFKFPAFLRIAYAPYIRTKDWKEVGILQNMVFGVGYRFHKWNY